MSKTIILTATLFILFAVIGLMSCSDVKPLTEQDLRKGMTKDSTFIKRNDSLKRVVSGLIQTTYDSVVTSLKSLPEHKNSIFLTPKQTQDYLASASRNQSRFVVEKEFFSTEDKNWEKHDDTTMYKFSQTWTCHINFDTTQSLSPVITVKRDWYNEIKNTVSKEEDMDYSHSVFTFYYIPRLNIGYIVDYNQSGISPRNYSESLSSYEDRDIRNNFIFK